MSKKRVAVLGATGAMGTKVLNALKGNEDYEVVAVSLYAQADKVKALAEAFPTIKWVAVISTDNVKGLSDDIALYTGEESNGEIVRDSKADIVVNAIWGMVGLTPTLDALKAGKTVWLANKASLIAGRTLVAEALKTPNAKLVPLDDANSILPGLLAQADEAKAVSKIDVVTDGGSLRDYPLDKIAVAPNAAIVKTKDEDDGRRSACNAALMTGAYFDCVTASILLNRPLADFSVKTETTGKVKAVLQYEDNTYLWGMAPATPFAQAISDAPVAVKVPDDSLTVADYDTDRYPLVSYLFASAAKFGLRSDIAALAADEVAINKFLTGKIRFGDMETVIRRTVSDTVRSIKEPKTADDIQHVYALARKNAQDISDSIANAIANGITLKAAHKAKKNSDRAEAAKEESLEERAKRKKASRWKNDPSKKKLWEEHEKKRAIKAKAEAKSSARTRAPKVEIENVPASESKEGAFPVVLVNEDAEHRMDRNAHRGESRGRFDRQGYGSRSSYGHSSYGKRPYGDKPSYGHSSYGHKPYGTRSYGESRSSEAGEKRSYGHAGKPGFGRDSERRSSYGEHRSYRGGEGHSSYGRSSSSYGKRSYGDRPSYGHSSYGHSSYGEHKTYGHREDGEKKSYGSRSGSYGRSSYGRRSYGSKGTGRSYGGERRSFGKKPFGGKKFNKD